MKNIFTILFLFTTTFSAFATHNRAGEITYKCLGGDKYGITVTTYTKIASPADRCELTVHFGDGDSAIAPRTNNVVTSGNCYPEGQGDVVPSNTAIRKNIYYVEHLYPGPGQYYITMYDPNRNSDIINIANSVNTPFFIKSFLMINSLLGTCNNSPILLNPPIDNGCLYRCFYHNPSAYDPDGDSLAYSLGLCLGYGGQPVQSFTDPTYPLGVSVNSLTGDLVWCAPQPFPNVPFPQEYNFAMYIKEYRKLNNQWFLIGYVERDLQVDINDCPNRPPQIANLNDTCVLAGDTLTFQVNASDPDVGQHITLSASGGPISNVIPAAVFIPGPASNPTSGTFSWTTDCNMVRDQSYQVVFRAQDDDGLNPLAFYQTAQIKIVAPPPLNLTATPSCDQMILSWDPSGCDPNPDHVTGYKIYRLASCDNWVHSYCETGVPGYTGYVLIGSTTGVNSTTFTDNNGGNGLSHGVTYAYHVVAQLFDGAQSYASNRVCKSLVRDVPIMTNVDVTSTSTSTGTMNVRWVPPLATPGNLDTNAVIGPYTLRLYRRNAFTNASTLITTFSAPNFAGTNGISSFTNYADNSLNTDGGPYVYNIQLIGHHTDNSTDSLCRAKEASSVYLTLTPNDNRLTLNWNFNVPWTNYKYYIYRKIPVPFVPYTLIDSTTLTTYTDDSLANLRTYCYKIEAFGQYSDTSITRPLINWSEEKCGMPQDLTAPCPPVLSLASDCNANENTLNWTDPNVSCTDGTNDVVSYNIYYTPIQGNDMTLLVNIPSANILTYVHDSLSSIAGCYQITAVDSFGNQSAFSNMMCADNCPIYDLPNVFTPNGDGINDLFVPFPYKYVKSIDLTIFNRWGNIVFTSSDPNINWDGKNAESKELCSDGVYYYVCIVNEIHLDGIKPRTLKGYVQILQHEK